jgi:hypothetical protein
MPPTRYSIVHSEAQLSAEEKQLLVGMMASIGGDRRGRQSGPGGGDGRGRNRAPSPTASLPRSTRSPDLALKYSKSMDS